MKTWGVCCTFLHVVDAETAEEAEEMTKEFLATEIIGPDDFNDIEVSPLQW